MSSIGEILDLIAIDVMAVGVITVTFALLFRHLWLLQPPNVIRATWTAVTVLRDRIATPGVFVLLLVPAAIVGAVMDVVADELLDGPFVTKFPAIPPELGDILDLGAWRDGFLVGFREEDQLKREEVDKLPQALGAAQLRFVTSQITIEPGSVSPDYERKVKGLFQHAIATIRASDKEQLLAALRAETRTQKILRIVFIGMLLTSLMIVAAVARYVAVSRSGLERRVLGHAFLFFVLAGFLTLLSLRLWTDQSLRLYKQTLHAYLAVANVPSDEAETAQCAVVLRGLDPCRRETKAASTE
jgi:hypothetical protein